MASVEGYPKAPTTFVEGSYGLPGGVRRYASDSYELRGGWFLYYESSCTQHPPPEPGRYQVEGATLHLTFENPSSTNIQDTPPTLHWRWIDGVIILMNDSELAILESENRLLDGDDDDDYPNEPEPLYYVLSPDGEYNYNVWWKSLLKRHPKFAKLVEDGEKEKAEDKK